MTSKTQLTRELAQTCVACGLGRPEVVVHQLKVGPWLCTRCALEVWVAETRFTAAPIMVTQPDTVVWHTVATNSSAGDPPSITQSASSADFKIPISTPKGGLR